MLNTFNEQPEDEDKSKEEINFSSYSLDMEPSYRKSFNAAQIEIIADINTTATIIEAKKDRINLIGEALKYQSLPATARVALNHNKQGPHSTIFEDMLKVAVLIEERPIKELKQDVISELNLEIMGLVAEMQLSAEKLRGLHQKLIEAGDYGYENY